MSVSRAVDGCVVPDPVVVTSRSLVGCVGRAWCAWTHPGTHLAALGLGPAIDEPPSAQLATPERGPPHRLTHVAEGTGDPTPRRTGVVTRPFPIPGAPPAAAGAWLLSAATGTEAGTDQESEALGKIADPWITLVWNDPVNLMTYVTYVFQAYFGYGLETAEKLMRDVHVKGRAVVSSGTLEEMERDTEAMHGYGLWATFSKSGQ